jgi:hypothetical protein
VRFKEQRFQSPFLVLYALSFWAQRSRVEELWPFPCAISAEMIRDASTGSA